MACGEMVFQRGSHTLLAFQRKATVALFAYLLQNRQTKADLSLVVLAGLGVERIEGAALRGFVHALAIVGDFNRYGRAVFDKRHGYALRPRFYRVLRSVGYYV